MEIEIKQAIEIAISNADMAIDQQHMYRDLADAVDSGFENVCDTLVEYKIMNDLTLHAAREAYQKRIDLLTTH